MKKIIIALSLILACAGYSFADTYVPGTNCLAIYQVPEGQPYSTKVLRPPFFTVNRWECLTTALSRSEFSNSPASGTDTDFQLAIGFVTDPPLVTYYPILYVGDWLEVFVDDVGISNQLYSVDQGTGVVHFYTAPAQGSDIAFDVELQIE